MTRSLSGLPVAMAVLGLGLALPAAAGSSWSQGRGNVSVSTNNDNPVRSCADIHVVFSGREAARGEETLSAVPGRGPLTLRLPQNSGMWVRGSERRDYGVLACKAADTTEKLSRIAVSLDGGELKASGPEEGDWLVHFIVEAPRGADLDLEGRNGPIHGSETGREKNGDAGAQCVQGGSFRYRRAVFST